MRFLVIVNVFSPIGGLEIYGRKLVEVLEKLEHKVEVWSIFENISDSHEETCELHYLAPRGRQAMRIYYRLRTFILASRLLKNASRFDVVICLHPNNSSAMYITSLFRPDLRYWIWTHGSDIWPEWSWHMRKGLAGAECILAVSKYSRDSIMSRLANSRVELIPPPVCLEHFTVGHNLNQKKERPILLTVCRLGRGDRYKGHDLVIKALPEIEKKLGQKVLFRIVGKGDDIDSLKMLADEYGVGSSVQFMGRVSDSDLVTYYQECDLFIMPSRVGILDDGSWTGEGFGIVYIEAAACGKPVIGSNQGGATDAFIDGVTGIGVNPDSIPEIIEAVYTILSNPSLKRQLGEAGRKFVEENFSLEAFSRRIEKLIG